MLRSLISHNIILLKHSNKNYPLFIHWNTLVIIGRSSQDVFYMYRILTSHVKIYNVNLFRLLIDIKISSTEYFFNLFLD